MRICERGRGDRASKVSNSLADMQNGGPAVEYSACERGHAIRMVLAIRMRSDATRSQPAGSQQLYAEVMAMRAGAPKTLRRSQSELRGGSIGLALACAAVLRRRKISSRTLLQGCPMMAILRKGGLRHGSI